MRDLLAVVSGLAVRPGLVLVLAQLGVQSSQICFLDYESDRERQETKLPPNPA